MTLVTPESPEYKKWREENGPKLHEELRRLIFERCKCGHSWANHGFTGCKLCKCEVPV